MTTIESLKQERKRIRGGKGKRGRSPRSFYPKTAESFYRRRLLDMVRFLIRTTEEVLVSRIPILENEVSQSRGDSVRLDVLTPGDINDVVGQIILEFDKRYPQRNREELIEEVSSKTIGFNQKQVEKQVGHFIGRDFVFGAEPYLNQEVLLFQAFNVNLINSIPDEFKTRLSSSLLSQLQAGASARDIIKNIRKTYPISENKARRIAFDQIGKFNGAIDKTRFEQMGVEKYKWNTQEDGRVRESHRALNGKIRTWDQSPIPGEEINCRCYATAVFEDD